MFDQQSKDANEIPPHAPPHRAGRFAPAASRTRIPRDNALLALSVALRPWSAPRLLFDTPRTLSVVANRTAAVLPDVLRSRALVVAHHRICCRRARRFATMHAAYKQPHRRALLTRPSATHPPARRGSSTQDLGAHVLCRLAALAAPSAPLLDSVATTRWHMRRRDRDAHVPRSANTLTAARRT